MSTTPLTILTGFLGAGKTTLLQRILADESYGDSVVLINEFGAVGIDQHLVAPITDNIVLLESGCICCQIRGDLKEALINILHQRATQTIPAFKRIIIETTGLAEPTPIIATILADPILVNQLHIHQIITVIDALNAQETALMYPTWWQQVSAADTILISKVDLVTDQCTELITWLNQYISEIPIYLLSPDKPLPALTEKTAKVAARSLTPRYHSHHHIRTMIIPLSQKVDWIAFSIWLSALLHCHGNKILRIKGIIDIGNEYPILINGVQHMVYPPQHIEEKNNTDTNQLVMIMDGIDPDEVQQSFIRHVLQ